jgi:preprotein translocase subunit SecA
MVSRRIEAAQKKVEERNFDIRKNLLEYDEVMDHQRKRVYSYRQKILEGANPKVLLLEMIDQQLDLAIDRFLDDTYGPASFAEFAANRLGIEFDASDFAKAAFEEAENTAREKANRMVPTQILEAMDENLSEDEDPKDWNWQAMAGTVNNRWGLKLTDRQLKQIGRDNLAQHLTEQAAQAIEAVDLKGGKQFLDPDWGERSLSDWARLKFQIPVDAAALVEKNPAEIKELLRGKVLAIYRQKEIELPVKAGMSQFMADRPQQPGMGQRYDREGLFRWSRIRFGKEAETLTEEEFRTQSRAKLHERLVEVSQRYSPAKGEEALDEKLEETFSGTQLSEAEDAKELVEWFRTEMGVEVPDASLTGVSQDDARQVLWNAFDDKYRPEMRGVERGLLLDRLDSSWKNHLYTMDHLRAGIGLMSYAQVDPKTEYKRQGMKEFDSMWEGVQDKVTDSVFRMEEEVGFQESLWAVQTAVHESAPRPTAPTDGQDQGLGNQSGKKQEPIRNRTEKVGRNDPCPCGSGKKYKNCCMKKAAV